MVRRRACVDGFGENRVRMDKRSAHARADRGASVLVVAREEGRAMIGENVRSRTSRSNQTTFNIAKTLLQTVIFWGFFLFVVPALISWIESRTGLLEFRFDLGNVKWLAAVMFALAGSLGIWSGVTMAALGKGTPLPFDCPSTLVVAGPYRHVRNPMVIAGLAQGIAVGMWLGSWPVIIYSLLGAPVWMIFVQPWEERDLSARFDEEYVCYRSAVKCWIPRLRPYHGVDELETE